MGWFGFASPPDDEPPAMASAQERTDLPSSQASDGQRMPFNWLAISPISTPDFKAREMRREVASNWAEAQPPALPSVPKTSQIPFSSEATVT